MINDLPKWAILGWLSGFCGKRADAFQRYFENLVQDPLTALKRVSKY
jgi:hypothetical protein